MEVGGDKAGDERAGEVAEDGEDERPGEASGDAESDDVSNTVLEAAEDEEGDAKDDAERGAEFVHFDGEIHDDATKERFDEEGEGEVPSGNFVYGSFGDGGVSDAEEEADEVAGSEVDGKDNQEVGEFEFAFEKEATFAGEEVEAEVADAKQAKGENDGADGVAEFEEGEVAKTDEEGGGERFFDETKHVAPEI